MAVDSEFGFRETSGYVTDNANGTYVLGETSAQTRGGVTFSWGSGVNIRNRKTDAPPYLAGTNHINNTITPALADWTVTLPNTGTYRIRVAMGDPGFATENYRFRLYDNATQFVDVNQDTIAADTFADCIGAEIARASWESTNTYAERVMGSTTLIVRIGATAAIGASVMSGLWIEEQAVGVVVPALDEGVLVGGMMPMGGGLE